MGGGMSIEAMKQALEALEVATTPLAKDRQEVLRAQASLRAAIADAEKQEPVAHLWQHSETGRTRIVMPDQIVTTDATWFMVGPLYLGATPPAAQQEPLTEWQIIQTKAAIKGTLDVQFIDFARAIEAKHGIGEKK